ncbi:MAG TPA: DnaJ domain-containing protein [Candidatus Limnocylindrales bacterium]
MPDHYEVLQVHPRAQPEIIRAAYRILARKYHPDTGGDAKRMVAINDAWDVLGDPIRRAAYDAARSAADTLRPSAGQGTPGGTPGSAPERTRTTQPEAGHAGPPPGHPSGTVLDFGRYAGWSLGEIARYDTDYLEWLVRATFGRRLREEIDALLRQKRGSSGASASNRGWRHRS